MINVFNKNKYLDISITALVLIVFISVAIFYNLSLVKQTQAGFFSDIFNGVKNAILSVIKQAVGLIVSFVRENIELFMAAAVVWKWYTSPDASLREVFATVKSIAVHIMLSLITMDIIRIIQGEEPTHIDDWGDFLKEAADLAGGVFIEQYLGMGYLCEQFDLDIKIGLLDTTSFPESVRCSISDIVANIEDFQNDWNAGGWKGWIELAKPENTAYGAIILAHDEKTVFEERAKEAAQSEAIAGQGFLGRKCKQADIDAGRCTRIGQIITPGSVISGMTNNILKQPLDIMRNITSGIVDIIPYEYQHYAEAVLAAFFNQMIRDAMGAILGRSIDTDYGTMVTQSFEGATTGEAVDVETANAQAGVDALNTLKTKLNEITNFLTTIYNKETNILTSSARNLFDEESICQLPSFESYVIDSETGIEFITQEITLTAIDVGTISFERQWIPAAPDLPITITLGTTSVEITSEQNLYTPINADWSTAYTQYQEYLTAARAWRNDPDNPDLEAAAATEESEALAAANTLLNHWGLSADDAADAIFELDDATSILSDQLGADTYDPTLSADAYSQPFLSSYYFKYYYDLIPKETELNDKISSCP